MKETENIRLSIIIPGYNTPKIWWERCLKSVLAACGQNDEIICVDDGSTDNSGKILEEYAKKDARIKIVTKTNGGLSSARNEGKQDDLTTS